MKCDFYRHTVHQAWHELNQLWCHFTFSILTWKGFLKSRLQPSNILWNVSICQFTLPWWRLVSLAVVRYDKLQQSLLLLYWYCTRQARSVQMDGVQYVKWMLFILYRELQQLAFLVFLIQPWGSETAVIFRILAFTTLSQYPSRESVSVTAVSDKAHQVFTNC